LLTLSKWITLPWIQMHQRLYIIQRQLFSYCLVRPLCIQWTLLLYYIRWYTHSYDKISWPWIIISYILHYITLGILYKTTKVCHKWPINAYKDVLYSRVRSMYIINVYIYTFLLVLYALDKKTFSTKDLSIRR